VSGRSFRDGIRPPLRWAGSKRGQVPRLLRMLPPTYDRYIEPFAGSACLFFHLRPQFAVLGDINADLVAFYDTLATRPRRLLRALQRLAPDGSDYYEVRSTSGRSGSAAASARFLYLNRFCFNGVYRTDRRGRFNVPRGKHTGVLPATRDLLAASRLLRSTTRIAGDFEVTLSAAEPGDFVYLDPPYARRRAVRPGEYGHRSLDGETDLCRLACSLDELDRRGVRYLVSYMRSKRAAHLIPHVSLRYLRVRRNVGGFAATRRASTEMLLANYKL